MVDVTPVAVGGVASFTFDGTTVNGATNVKLTFGPSLVDVTELGDTFVNRWPTITDWSVTFDIVYDSTDAGQTKIMTNLFTPVRRTFVMTLTGGTLTGSCYVESADFTFDPKEVHRVSVTLKGTSLLVFA